MELIKKFLRRLKNWKKFIPEKKINFADNCAKSLKIENEIRAENFHEAQKLITRHVSYLEKKEGKNTNRIGICYDNLALCNINLMKYEIALEFSRKAQKKFAPNSYNEFVSKIQETTILFLSGNHREVLINVNQFLRPKADLFKLNLSNYFLACIAIQEGNFKEALILLNTSVINSEEIKIFARFYIILCYVGMKDLENAARILTNLKKIYKSRSGRNWELIKFISAGMDRLSKETISKKNHEFETLPKPKTQWLPSKGEIIQVDTQLLKMLEKFDT